MYGCVRVRTPRTSDTTQITLINKSSSGRGSAREGGVAALKSCHAKDVHGKKLIKLFAHNNSNSNNNIRLNEIFICQWTEVARHRERWGGGVFAS